MPIYTRRYIYETHYSLLWCTKNRLPVFSDNTLASQMKDLLTEIAKVNGVIIETLKLASDYVYLQCSFKPFKAATDIIKALKGRSAFLFFQANPALKTQLKAHLWENTYCFATKPLSEFDIQAFINNPKYNKKEVN